ncbi:MAG: hypothetical protein KBH26_04570, partial [Thiopseudomonas sp.]|nr:hypothetical protein [Thiopseudomonas sp.]
KPQWLPEALDEFQLLISHRDQVTALPAGATLLAQSEFCENAAFIIGQQVLCFQGHPEFTHDFSRQLLQIRQAVYCPDEYQAACNSLQDAHDGQAIAQWMLCFVQAAKDARKASDAIDAVTDSVSEPLCLV